MRFFLFALWLSATGWASAQNITGYEYWFNMDGLNGQRVFVPAGNAAAERSDMIREYILRVMRGPMQALEALTENDPPIESICEELIQN